MLIDEKPCASPREMDPCPLCKSPIVSMFERRFDQQDSLFVVSCESDDCDFVVEVYGESPEEAVRRWNTRPAPAACDICGKQFQKGDDVVLLPARGNYHQACYMARSAGSELADRIDHGLSLEENAAFSPPLHREEWKMISAALRAAARQKQE